MPNGIPHMVIAAGVVGGAVAYQESQRGVQTSKPVIAMGLATFLANIPDQLEPAIHPHHRQFFHSLTFGATVGCVAYQIYQWQPVEEWQKVLRFGLLVACGAYLTHLAADALTTRSLPLLGKL